MEEPARPARRKQARYLPLKRLLDIFFSALLLLLLLLPMAVIGLAVGLSSRGGILFRQRRIGRGGRAFTCYKFRTMCREAPPNRSTADFLDAARYVTPLGRFLRRTSLDELPQLWNVLRGDMSLVGPRPLIGEEREMHRLRNAYGVYGVRPGMTGLAQIMGRDRLDDCAKAAYDARYVERLSLREDLWIVGQTLWRVLSGVNVK